MLPQFQGFFQVRTLEELDSFTQELWREYPDECQQLIVRSRRFTAGIYLFDNEWDMEPTVDPVHWQLNEIQWDTPPNGDPEWCYMLNRQRFLVDVAFSFVLTREESDRQYLTAFLMAFLQENPLDNQATHSWRTIDVGLRLVNWLKIYELHHCLPIFTVEESKLLEAAMIQHAVYLNQHLSIERGQSNWQILEIAGLYGASLAFSTLQEAEKWRENSLFYLKHSLALQVEPDGLQREQSFMYHNEVLLSLLSILQLNQRNQQAPLPEVLATIEKMATAAGIFAQPDLNQPPYGDSDVEGMLGLLQYAELVSDTSLETDEPSVSVNFFARVAYGRLKKKVRNRFVIPETSHFFENSGLMISKQAKTYCLFKCGPLGGGHGHDDQLHISFYQKKAILIDSGRYTYEINKGRLLFKEAAAHNTILVDGQNFNQHQGAWDSQKVATPINQKKISKEGYHYFEGGHLGYFQQTDPVLVNRKLLQFPEGLLLISDEYFCHSEHEVSTSFHFDTNDLTLNDKFTSQRLGYSLFCLDTATDLRICDRQISSHYNQQQSIKCGIAEKKINQTSVTTYLLAPNECVKKIIPLSLRVDGQLVTPEVAEAFSIDFGDSEKTVILQHQEPPQGRRAYQISERYYYGRIIVVDQQPVILY